MNVFVGDTAHLRVSGKSVCHFLQDFLTGGSGTGGFRKGVDLPEKRIFCIIKQGKKTREVTSPGPWPLISTNVSNR